MTASGVVVCTCFDIRSARRTAGPCAQVVVSANRKSGACGSTLYGAHHPPRRSNPLVFLGNVASTNPRVARAYVRFASLSNVPGKRRTCNQLMATSNSFSRSKLGLPHLRHQLRQHCSQCWLLRHVAADASQPVLRVSDVLCAQNVLALLHLLSEDGKHCPNGRVGFHALQAKSCLGWLVHQTPPCIAPCAQSAGRQSLRLALYQRVEAARL